MSLIGEERKDYILHVLNLEGKVKTYDLVDKLKVSSETIRRYMEELEEQNLLKRVYGGAVKVDLAREEPPHIKREITHADEKKRIGRAAASLIEDNDVIYIDDGTTTQQVVHFLLGKKNITVLTVSVPTLHFLIDYKNKELFTGDIYFIGGRVNALHSRVSGSFAEKMVESFYADKAFISIDGMMMEQGITSFDPDRGQLARKMMGQSKTNIVLTDHSKFGAVQFHKIADWKEIDIVISNVNVPQEWEAYLTGFDVNWICAE